jgi:LCP family protein required for cell wall assembly
VVVSKKLNKTQKQTKKRNNFFKRFNRSYPIYLVTGGLLLGMLLSVFAVAGVALADLYGRVLSPEDISMLNNSDWQDKDSQDLLDGNHLSGLGEEESGLNKGTDPDTDKIKGTEDGQLQTEAGGLLTMNGIENILIIGTDTATFSGRSDVMIIASLNHNTRKLNLASLYRAANVNIPGYGEGLLNAAYAYGGADLLIRTIEANFRVPIDGYVIFNFNSFIYAIDVMGGVSIYLSDAEAAALGMYPGNNWATSSQALSYVRLRKIDTDFNRMGRQRQVLNAVLNQLSACSAVTIYNVATVLLPSVATDLDVMSYVSKAHTYLSYSRDQIQIPRTCDMWMFYNYYGQEVGGFDYAATAKVLRDFLTN